MSYLRQKKEKLISSVNEREITICVIETKKGKYKLIKEGRDKERKKKWKYHKIQEVSSRH